MHTSRRSPLQAMLDGHGDVHGVLHGLDAVGDQVGFGHQAGTERAALHAPEGQPQFRLISS